LQKALPFCKKTRQRLLVPPQSSGASTLVGNTTINDGISPSGVLLLGHYKRNDTVG